MNDEFVKNIISLRDGEGEKWLKDIPRIIKKYEEKWGIRVEDPYHLSYNYVAPAKRKDGEGVVLKIGFPKDKEFKTEIEALKIFNGEGVVKILEEDLENAVILLERIEPGTLLRNIENDEEVTAIFANVIKKLQKHNSNNFLFPTLTEWTRGFERIRRQFKNTSGPFPKDLFEKAETIFKEYSKNTRNHVLLHGDLHNDNILLSKRGWLAIDPKGVVGPGEYETAAFLRNPFYDLPDSVDRKEVVKKRVMQFSKELGFDKQKILNFAFAQAILSGIWVLEDHKEKVDLYIKNAKLLSGIIV